jgi:hypothetical protein
MPTKGHVHVRAQSAPSPSPSGARAGIQAAYNLNPKFPPPALRSLRASSLTTPEHHGKTHHLPIPGIELFRS